MPAVAWGLVHAEMDSMSIREIVSFAIKNLLCIAGPISDWYNPPGFLSDLTDDCHLAFRDRYRGNPDTGS
jgi:hypothetical protein